MQKMKTFLEIANEVLQDANVPLGYKQLWERAKELGLDKNLKSIGKTPEQTMGAQLYVDIRDRQDSLFMVASRKPTTFWLKERQEELEAKLKTLHSAPQKALDNKSQEANTSVFKEEHLHPLLVRFVRDYFDAYSKTICHRRSKKAQNEKDKWSYPDIVSVHFPFNDYNNEESLRLAKNLHHYDFKIYSFELKIALDFSNLKRSYFQAVSNSSFANEGYLVVFNEIDSEVFDELRRLNQSFGIGLIKLGISELEVLLPSAQRHLDFQTIDMLVEKNPNFREFIKTINEDVEINDKRRILRDSYDRVLDDEALEKHIIDKKIM